MQFKEHTNSKHFITRVAGGYEIHPASVQNATPSRALFFTSLPIFPGWPRNPESIDWPEEHFKGMLVDSINSKHAYRGGFINLIQPAATDLSCGGSGCHLSAS